MLACSAAPTTSLPKKEAMSTAPLDTTLPLASSEVGKTTLRNDKEALAKEKMQIGSLSTFTFSNDTLVQMLNVEKKTSKKIIFTIESINKRSQRSSKINGTAILKNGDAETDEDEEGNIYPVNEYIFETPSCYLAIRIASELETYARIADGECSTGRQINAPYESVGILKRK